MNSLQLELDNINAQLELLTYRKTQLDSIMSEYSDVVNRVKSLVLSMEDANVEPTNLLLEIEGLIHCPDLQQEPTPEQQTEDVAAPEFKPDDIVQHKNNELWDGRQFRVKGVKGFEVLCAWESRTGDVAYSFPADAVELVQVEAEQEPDTVEAEAPKLNALGLPIQTSTQETDTKPEQIKRYSNNIYWDNGSGVRVFIAKKRRYKLELEAIAKDCIEQGYSSKFEIVECDGDWLVMFSHVTLESSVQGIIDNFYPKHTDGEPEPKTSNPEPVKLMALVPTVSTEPKPTKTQLNNKAWRRNDTLLIGFDNKRLMIAWAKWFNDSFNGGVFVKDDEQLDGFKYCLSVLWYGSDISTNWERLTALDYSLKPDEQPTGIKLDDVRDVILKLQDSGVKT